MCGQLYPELLNHRTGKRRGHVYVGPRFEPCRGGDPSVTHPWGHPQVIVLLSYLVSDTTHLIHMLEVGFSILQYKLLIQQVLLCVCSNLSTLLKNEIMTFIKIKKNFSIHTIISKLF